MNKSLIASVSLMAVVLTGCTMPWQEAEIGPGNAAFDQGVAIGQQATVVQLIEQSLENPCQTINLYNRADTENPREVNLINIQCEGLNLPDIEEASEAAE